MPSAIFPCPVRSANSAKKSAVADGQPAKVKDLKNKSSKKTGSESGSGSSEEVSAASAMDRDELRDRLEQTLGFSGCRLPRVLTVAAQRRRAGGMVKQWSMDETKSWFYSR